MVINAAHRFDNSLRYRDEKHPNQLRLTPTYVLEPIRQALGGEIALDPCTEPDNPCGAAFFYTPPQDGATLPWDVETIFCNPPYGKARERWVKRCIQAGQEGRQVVLLMPAHPDTRIFHEALATSSSICFIKGRVKFRVLRPNRRQAAASHPSVIIGWNISLEPCSVLGTVIQLGGVYGR